MCERPRPALRVFNPSITQSRNWDWVWPPARAYVPAWSRLPSTAVRAPVLAVIEYNYERDGEIIVPAGAKAIGHIRDANRSGYVDLQFDSLLMPDGACVPLEAAATDLDLRPLKGKVSGKNTGKNVFGQIAVRNRPSQRHVRGTRAA